MRLRVVRRSWVVGGVGLLRREGGIVGGIVGRVSDRRGLVAGVIGGVGSCWIGLQVI